MSPLLSNSKKKLQEERHYFNINNAAHTAKINLFQKKTVKLYKNCKQKVNYMTIFS